MDKTICFTGHRIISDDCYPRLKAVLDFTIEQLVQGGAVHFRTGGALGFDTMAALCVLAMQRRYPQIRLHLILPCPTQTRGWSENDVALYRQIMEKASSVRYVSQAYFSGVLQMRNRALVEGTNVCVAYLTHSRGGTAYTAAYALQNGVELINLADEF